MAPGSLQIDPAIFEGKRIHVHAPTDAIPKDGPSAGVTMLTALASLASGRPVCGDLAMTGEITLRGKVLPVGSIKEKVLAAHLIGIRQVILPRRNRREAKEVPREARKEMEFHFVDTAEEVLELAFVTPEKGGGRPPGSNKHQVALKPTSRLTSRLIRPAWRSTGSWTRSVDERHKSQGDRRRG